MSIVFGFLIIVLIGAVIGYPLGYRRGRQVMALEMEADYNRRLLDFDRQKFQWEQDKQKLEAIVAHDLPMDVWEQRFRQETRMN